MPWLRALMNPAAYPHPTGKIEHLHTHISDVFLTGPFAYKVKKVIDLKFLDFSTLDKRKFFCEREIELNRRLAPEIYLGVVPITEETNGEIRVDGLGKPVEYAVKMTQFDQNGLLDVVAERGELKNRQIHLLAEKVADFHRLAGRADGFGGPSVIGENVLRNFEQTESIRGVVVKAERFDRLREFSERFLKEKTRWFENRAHSGAIRICHGDLHLKNICWDQNHLIIFDCIEFNEALNHIDVMSEIAFLLMDLDHRGLSGLGGLFLNTYLDRTQDYPGLAMLDFYLIYRACVRAKVASFLLSDPDQAEKEKAEARKQVAEYFKLADRYLTTHHPRLVVMSGISGSGKSTVAADLARMGNGIVIRSDAVRKHLAGLGLSDRSGGSGNKAGIYSNEMTDRTYARILKAAEPVVASGRWAILDATYSDRRFRRAAREWAEKKGVPFGMIHCTAPVPEMERRLLEREEAGTDASDAGIEVMRRQMASFDPMDPSEERFTTVVPTEKEWDIGRIIEKLKKKSLSS